MKHRVDSPQGKEIYSHRMSVVEPMFGYIGTNKGLNRFSLRSRNRVQGQWHLYCLVQILKSWRITGGWQHETVIPLKVIAGSSVTVALAEARHWSQR
jgi:hypothetical protein